MTGVDKESEGRRPRGRLPAQVLFSGPLPQRYLRRAIMKALGEVIPSGLEEPSLVIDESLQASEKKEV